MTALSLPHAGDLLRHLIAECGWRNSDTALAEAIPHLAEEMSAQDLLQTLQNLKIPYSTLRCREAEITHEECPALVLLDDGSVYLVLGLEVKGLKVLEPGATTTTHRVPARGRCLLVHVERQQSRSAFEEVVSVSGAFQAMRPMLPWLLVSSFLVNLLGLLAPLLIMGIYDRVIPSGSEGFLGALAVGVVVILTTDFALRHVRARALAYVGRDAERTLSLALFRKLMALPLTQLQKSDIDQQLSRFRQFEALREIFTGQVMTTLLDLPFALIFLGLLLYLAPAVGLLTVAVAIIFALHSALTVSAQRRLDDRAIQATIQNRSLVQDAVAHQRAIVDLGLDQTWRDRSQPLAEAAEADISKARQFQATQQAIARTVNGLATVLAIIISAHAALSGEMSFGVLIAVIALVSKVLAPIHALHANAPQILSFRQSRSQADRVLSLTEEMELGLGRSYQKTLSGQINFNGVTHKPDPLNAPVLSQARFQSEAGELVVVMGSDLSGRSAVLHLIDGLMTPLVGTVNLDGIDIRQIARDELRQSITYATYDLGLFYGTIAQNFRLAAPTLSDTDIERAIEQIGLSSEINNLPKGINTRLTDGLLVDMPKDVKRALQIARCLARPGPILMFSEPTNDLNPAQRNCFKQWITTQRGARTIIIATADRSLLGMADRFIYLDDGRVTVNDTGTAGLKKMQTVLNSQGTKP